MRSEFEYWAAEYPKAASAEVFTGSVMANFVRTNLRLSVEAAVPQVKDQFKFVASPGKGGWTDTPWVAILDPTETTSVERGFYVVYLLSKNGKHLYLSLNQGCTKLKDEVGIPKARDELVRRALSMRSRVEPGAVRFKHSQLDLMSSSWRAKLYAAGDVLNVEYDTSNLPIEDVLVADLNEGLQLYRRIRIEGGWSAEDEMLEEAEAASLKPDAIDGKISLQLAKRYRQHRQIERPHWHARLVKKVLGTRCMGCDWQMAELYGSIGCDVIEAHHLVALASLDADQKPMLDPAKDFAVLCPNCHAIIHKMDDVSDVSGLRTLIERARAQQAELRLASPSCGRAAGLVPALLED